MKYTKCNTLCLILSTVVLSYHISYKLMLYFSLCDTELTVLTLQVTPIVQSKYVANKKVLKTSYTKPSSTFLILSLNQALNKLHPNYCILGLVPKDQTAIHN